MLSKASLLHEEYTRNTTKENSKTRRLLIFIYISIFLEFTSGYKQHTHRKSPKKCPVDIESFIYWNLKGNTVTFSPLSKSQKQSLKHPVKAQSKKSFILNLEKVYSKIMPTSTTNAHLAGKTNQNKKKKERKKFKTILVSAKRKGSYLVYFHLERKEGEGHKTW